jgi:hypothetical protein
VKLESQSRSKIKQKKNRVDPFALIYKHTICKKMNLTPPQNRGMTALNKDAFKKTFTTLAIRTPNSLVKQFTTVLEKYNSL